MQRRLALKIEVGGYRGTRDGVPRLVDILARHDVRATFLFSLGPDRTGRAPLLAPQMPPGRAARTLIGRLGVSVLYGTLLPAPDVGLRCGDTLRMVREAGHEAGILGFDTIGWRQRVDDAEAAWTLDQLEKACERFFMVFGAAPKTRGAPAWQINAHALRATQRLGFDYCSDTRGTHPFVPVQRAEIVACPQIPTTLPTLDELMALDSADPGNAARRLLALTAPEPASEAFAGHVFTLRAELEGMALSTTLETLLEGWRAQGYALCPLREIYDSLDLEALPRHEVRFGRIPGRTETVLLQAEEFLAGA